MLSRPAAMVWARVVLPAWRGPSNATAGICFSRSSRNVSMRRAIILVIMAYNARFARLWYRIQAGFVSGCSPELRLGDDSVTAYSYIWRNKEKLLGKAKRNPNGFRFSDLEVMLRQCGWTFDRQTGSHGAGVISAFRIWYSPRKYRISFHEASDGKAKGYQVRQ